MDKLAALQNATSAEQHTAHQNINAGRAGEQMISLAAGRVTSVLTGLSDIEKTENKMLDINTMMTAFEDYVTRCVQGGDMLGVPINYYLKTITKSDILTVWLAKYYPQRRGEQSEG
jgi:hypothetical protein